MTDARPTIAIDARSISHPQPGGFKTYAENLFPRLVELDSAHRYLFYTDRQAGFDLGPPEAGAEVKIVGPAKSFLAMPAREQIGLPLRLRADRADLAHFIGGTASLWNACPCVVTIHDTIEFSPLSRQYAGRSPKRIAMHLYNRLGTLAAVRNAKAILTVSENSKADIARLFSLPPDRVRVARLAPGPHFRPAERQAGEAFLAARGLAGDFVLGIGSADPRKNIRALIEAYSRLPAELIARHALVITFTHPRFRDDVTALARQLGIDGRLHCLERVSNPDLALLYGAAAVFVYPSLYEGFGLPPLEAMACGAPVVAADNSSLPEVLGEAAALVDVGAANGDAQGSARLAQAMAPVLSDAGLRARLRRQGIDRAAQFSWRRCAAETAEVYRSILQKTRPAPGAGEKP